MRIGDYHVLEELGRGAMGVVYRARSPQLDRDVAIKLLPRDKSDHQRERFRREAHALARLRHPHVVRVHHVGEHEGAPYIAMEYIDGQGLEQRLAARGPLPPGYAAELFVLLARALAHAHAQGILHRDLKPANVLLAATGEPYLADFGLAKDMASFAGGLTQEGALLGTPGYWSPEQAGADHDGLGPQTDVYGLGATLYAALTGEPPFAGESLAELAVAAQERAPVPPHELQPQVPRRLSAICMRCLEKSPARRYATAGALADDLEAFLGVGAAPQPAPRGVRGLVLGALVLLAVCAALAWRLAQPSPSPQPSPSSAEPEVEDPELARGLASLEDKDGAAAQVAFAALLARDPDHALGQIGMGDALLLLHDYEQAIEWFSKGLERRPDVARAHLGRGLARYMLEDPERAVVGIRRSLELDPTNVRAHYNLGIVLLSRKDYAGANDAFSHAIEGYGPGEDQCNALLNRSAARFQLEQWELAEADLVALLEQRPRTAKAHYNLGKHHERAKRWREAALSYQATLDCVSDNPALRASSLASLARVQEHVKFSPDFDLTPDQHALLASFHEANGDERHEDALDHLRELDRAKPNSPSVLNLLGTQLTAMGRPQEALAVFERAFQLLPDASFRFNTGLARLAAKDEAGALNDFDAFVAARPEDPDGHMMRGKIHARLGNRPLARRDLQRALELFPPRTKQARELREILAQLNE